MKIIDAQPIPIYENKCPECGSLIRYKACEVSFLHITCPVCGVAFWANTISPVAYELPVEVKVSVENKVTVSPETPDAKESNNYVPQDVPLRCRMCSFFVRKDLMTGECSAHGGVWAADDYCSKGAWMSNATN